MLWWFQDKLRDAGIDRRRSLADLGLNSLDRVELVMDLEQEFDLTIPDEDAQRIFSVEDAIRYIRHRRQDGSA